MKFISAIYMPRHNFWCMTMGDSQQKKSSLEGGGRTVRNTGLNENSGFEGKNLHFQYQWPKRNSFQGYSISNSILMQIWYPLICQHWGACTFMKNPGWWTNLDVWRFHPNDCDVMWFDVQKLSNCLSNKTKGLWMQLKQFHWF